MFFDSLDLSSSEERSVIFFGGDVVIGRRTNWNRRKKPFGNLQAMQDADLRIVNLECVAGAQGEQGIHKGESSSYYYHARPEQINLLTEANIDVVLTANNHSMDYYAETLLEQNEYLNRAGVLHCGSGANFDEASRPLFIKVNDIVVALFSVDATIKHYAATEDKAGIFYLPPSQPELWKKIFTEKIADARRKADIVLVAPHWGKNGLTEPREPIKVLGRLLIDCGADAVLGCHAHLMQGIENYKNRPIIYDAGNLIFDTAAGLGGAFSIVLSKRGVEEVSMIPLTTGNCRIVPMNEADVSEFCEFFIGLCAKLNTNATVDGEFVKVKFDPPPRAEHNLEPVELSIPRHDGEKIPPMAEPLPEWTAEKVPDNARIQPQNFGPINLVGCRIPPEYLLMTTRKMLYVETWWTCDEPTEKDLSIRLRGVPDTKKTVKNFGENMDHQGCDWMWPTNRWKPGVIYYERFGLRAPKKSDVVNSKIYLYVSVLDGKDELGKYIHPKFAKLQIPNLSTATPQT